MSSGIRPRWEVINSKAAAMACLSEVGIERLMERGRHSEETVRVVGGILRSRIMRVRKEGGGRSRTGLRNIEGPNLAVAAGYGKGRRKEDKGQDGRISSGQSERLGEDGHRVKGTTSRDAVPRQVKDKGRVQVDASACSRRFNFWKEYKMRIQAKSAQRRKRVASEVKFGLPKLTAQGHRQRKTKASGRQETKGRRKEYSTLRIPGQNEGQLGVERTRASESIYRRVSAYPTRGGRGRRTPLSPKEGAKAKGALSRRRWDIIS